MTAIEKGVKETFEHVMEVTFEGGKKLVLHRPRVSGKDRAVVGFCPETNRELEYRDGELYFRKGAKRYSVKVDENSKKVLDRYITDVNDLLRFYSKRLADGSEEVAIYQSEEGLYWITTFTELDFGYASPRFMDGLNYHLNQALGTNHEVDEMHSYLNSLLPNTLHGSGPDKPFRSTLEQFIEFIKSRQMREAN